MKRIITLFILYIFRNRNPYKGKLGFRKFRYDHQAYTLFRTDSGWFFPLIWIRFGKTCYSLVVIAGKNGYAIFNLSRRFKDLVIKKSAYVKLYKKNSNEYITLLKVPGYWANIDCIMILFNNKHYTCREFFVKYI